jgi:hypothetical protein
VRQRRVIRRPAAETERREKPLATTCSRRQTPLVDPLLNRHIHFSRGHCGHGTGARVSSACSRSTLKGNRPSRTQHSNFDHFRWSFTDKFPKNYRAGCLGTRRILDSQPRPSESISTRFWRRRKNAAPADTFRPTHTDPNWKSEESGITCVTVRSAADVSFSVAK